ncbi:MAG: ABC transporter ATP-binding protein [Phycisphaerae bacterium]
MSTTTSTPALDIHGLCFRYENGKGGFSLRLDSLRLERGEQILLRAGSGKGKSTLLNLIAGLMEPAEGRVLVAGQAIHALRGAARDRFRGRTIGMIFQTFNLLQGFSALENVEAALLFAGEGGEEQRRRATELLRRLGIERLESPVERLSVGQQQRVAVARAVACTPALVLADEPTASLDPGNAARAMELIQATCRERGAALLCVSHDPAMWNRFSRVQDL